MIKADIFQMFTIFNSPHNASSGIVTQRPLSIFSNDNSFGVAYGVSKVMLLGRTCNQAIIDTERPTNPYDGFFGIGMGAFTSALHCLSSSSRLSTRSGYSSARSLVSPISSFKLYSCVAPVSRLSSHSRSHPPHWRSLFRTVTVQHRLR